MPLIHVEWFPRPNAKKQEFARAIVRACAEVLGTPADDVEILFTDVDPGNWFVGEQSHTHELS